MALLSCVASILGALRHWQADRAAPAAVRRARRLAALTGLCFLAFLILAVATLSAGIEELVYGWPPMFRMALVFPLLAIPLTLGVLYFAFRAWKGGLFTLYERVQYGAIALAFAASLWLLNHLNLVGYHFG
ncbi:MAG: hypothetical protein ACREQY_24820 [Candidatus Binatia bacterium]